MIKLWTLGRIDLRDAEGRELRSILTQPKRMALLVYLASHSRTGFVTRDRVINLFWPEQNSERARSALSRALYRLRNALGTGIVLSRGDDELSVSRTAFWCDACAFEDAAVNGQQRVAVELYRGDLLDGFHVSEARSFDEWLDAERQRLRAMAHASAWRLSDAEERAGNVSAAVDLARWAVERSPYDESSLQRLLALLDRNGDRAGAVRTYEHFERRLTEDLELSPAPETRALADAIRLREHIPVGYTGPDRSTREIESHSSKAATTASAEASLRQVELLTRRTPRGKVVVAVAAVAIFLVLSGTIALWRPPSPAPDPSLVAVSRIENRTGDPALDALAIATTDWITRSVADVVTSVTTQMPIRRARLVEPETGRGFFRRRTEAPAGTYVSGELYRDRDRIRFHLRAVDRTRDSRAWTIAPLIAPRDSVDAVLRELGLRASGAVAALLHPGLSDWFPIATPPPTYDALVEYVRAMHAPRRWEMGPTFEHAAQIDTTFTLARLAAAEALLGSDPVKSQTLTSGLDRKRDQLPRLQQYLVDLMHAELAGDRMATYEALARAAGLAPTRYLGEHAASAHSLNRPRETLTLLDSVEQGQTNELPRSWRHRATLHHELGEHEQEAALVLRAREKRPGRLDALYAHAQALAASGRVPEVRAVLDSALAATRDPHYTVGNVMQVAAEELIAHGFVAASGEFLERAIDWYQTSPTTEHDPLLRPYNLAEAWYVAGRWSEARTLFLKLAETSSPQRVFQYGRLGAIAAHTGDRAGAMRYLSILEKLSAAEGQGPEALMARARITALLGDADGAIRLLRDAIGGQGMDLHTDHDLASLKENPAFREFTKPKG